MSSNSIYYCRQFESESSQNQFKVIPRDAVVFLIVANQRLSTDLRIEKHRTEKSSLQNIHVLLGAVSVIEIPPT